MRLHISVAFVLTAVCISLCLWLNQFIRVPSAPTNELLGCVRYHCYSRCCMISFLKRLIALAALTRASGGCSGCRAQAAHCDRFSCGGASAPGARAQLLCSTWHLPGPGIEPMSPAVAGGFLTTGPPGVLLCSLLCVSPVCPLLQVSLLGI